MTTKPTSMTISAKNGAKGAAKQVLTPPFFLENTPLSVETRLYAPGTEVIFKKKKKKSRHLNFRRNVGRDLELSSAVSCGFIKRPVFYYKIMVSLAEDNFGCLGIF